MADIIPNMNMRVGGSGPGTDELSLAIATWSNLNGANNVGSAVQLALHSDRTVQVRGCFNTATIVIEGSNDGTNYSNLTDTTGAPAAFTADGIKQLVEVPAFTRPRLVSNGAATNVEATMLLRRNAPLTR